MNVGNLVPIRHAGHAVARAAAALLPAFFAAIVVGPDAAAQGDAEGAGRCRRAVTGTAGRLLRFFAA